MNKQHLPPLTTLDHFIKDSQLWTSKKAPSKATLHRWMQSGKIITIHLYGKEYIHLHKTIRNFSHESK